MENNYNSSLNNVTAQASGDIKNNKLRGYRIAVIFLALIVIGLGIYFVIGVSSNKNGEIASITSGQSTDAETDVADPYLYRDLVSKTMRMNGNLSNYYDGNSFANDILYFPLDKVYNNSLSNAEKTYVLLETSHENFLTEYVSPGNDFYKDMATINSDFVDSMVYHTVEYIPAEAASNDYYDLFGENISTECSMDCAYGSNADVYYRNIIGGRGGLTALNVMGRVSKVTVSGDYGYVYLNAGVERLTPEIYEVRYDVYASAPADYSETVSEETDYQPKSRISVSDSNYDKFQGYRFVFKKNSKGFYSFSKVEKQ